ncbi:PilZ domain-containing protein [candidate division CSSED10-310 bacterium]|uniref:PilZ domain-containing protein n=1 Tax=candidate division CSSED10-310 bacterium TaxID=2855610 RepID=A0ABV6Z2M4_UNCC1
MTDKRKFKRRHLIYYLQVKDIQTDNFIGYVVDLSYSGLMIMSQNPIEVNKTFQLQVMIPNGQEEKPNYLDFEAKSVRSINTSNPHFYDTGFELLNVKMEDFKQIYEVIENLGFKE